MKSRPDNPRRLDVEGCAKGGIVLEGDTPLADLPRLLEMAHAQARPAATDRAHWRVEGEARGSRGGVPEIWLHLKADATMSLVCQRCLNPVRVDVDAQRSFRFVVGEDEAARLDEETEDDVLELPRSLDLHDLVEDELLLALPLVPRHETCPEPLLAPPDELAVDDPVHPFAALAALKRTRS